MSKLALPQGALDLLVLRILSAGEMHGWGVAERLSLLFQGGAAAWEPVQRLEPGQEHGALLQVLDRLRNLPGVAVVSAAEFNVLGRPWRNHFPLPGTPREGIEATMAPVTPGYFETMKIPLLRGRTF